MERKMYLSLMGSVSEDPEGQEAARWGLVPKMHPNDGEDSGFAFLRPGSLR